MANLPENPNCALSGTRYCAMLNMHTCDQCTIDGSKDSAEQIMDDLDIYESLLPKGGIARLFQSEECQLCKEKPARDRKGYAIMYLGHPDPKRVQRKWFRKRQAFGTIVPVQLSVCSKCRSTMLWIDYLPVSMLVLCGLVTLILMTVRSIRDSLADIAQWIPFVVWIAAVVLGYLIGKIIAVLIRRKADERMYVNICEHPVIREMMAKGWVPLGKGESKPDLLFSKSRKVRGLGTALPEDIPEDID